MHLFTLLSPLLIPQSGLDPSGLIIEYPLPFQFSIPPVALTLPGPILVKGPPIAFGNPIHQPTLTADRAPDKPVLNQYRILSTAQETTQLKANQENNNPNQEHECKLPHRSKRRDSQFDDFPRTYISIPFLKKKM